MKRHYEPVGPRYRHGPGMSVVFAADRPLHYDLDEALGRFTATPYGRGKCEQRNYGKVEVYSINYLPDSSQCVVWDIPGKKGVLVSFRTFANLPEEEAKATLDGFVDSFVEATGMHEQDISDLTMMKHAMKYVEMAKKQSH